MCGVIWGNLHREKKKITREHDCSSTGHSSNLDGLVKIAANRGEYRLEEAGIIVQKLLKKA